MADNKDNLIDEIDATAFDLLRKIREEAILAEKVKAFAETIRWVQVRKELVPSEGMKGDTKFLSLKELMKEDQKSATSRAPRSRRSADPPAAEAGSAPVEPEPAADTNGAEKFY